VESPVEGGNSFAFRRQSQGQGFVKKEDLEYTKSQVPDFVSQGQYHYPWQGQSVQGRF